MFRALRTLPPKEFARRVYYQIKKNIYPIDIPDITVRPGLDFLLLELPPRYQPLMPNGVGYVYNILKDCGIDYQVIDANIIFYHRYHSRRLLEKTGPIVTSEGYVMGANLWENFRAEDWGRRDVIEYFWPQIEDIIESIVEARTKAVGLSVHASNRVMAREFIRALRSKAPEIAVVVGGYDCLYRNVASHLIKDFDYMVIGEAEPTIKPLFKALARGERPKDLVGIISRFDTPGRVWVEPPVFEDLDSVGFPKYEWNDIHLYRTYNGYHMVPIAASRGCRWSRCRFCAECLPFKKRSPGNVADEIEFMVSKGFYKFHFNESDVNGDPQNLHDICSEVMRRGLKVQFVGQLRVDTRNTPEYLKHLAKAGFTHLRFGVDGWSANTLRLQKKGYNIKMVRQNLRDCHKAGIVVSVNVVIGVPGETESDIGEIMENFTTCKDYIGSVDSINTLILAAGSEYYKNPDKYNIRFRGNKEEIYASNPYFIPTDLWYSEEPFIDQSVRMRRMEKLLSALRGLGFALDLFSISDLEKRKDKTEIAST